MRLVFVTFTPFIRCIRLSLGPFETLQKKLDAPFRELVATLEPIAVAAGAEPSSSAGNAAKTQAENDNAECLLDDGEKVAKISAEKDAAAAGEKKDATELEAADAGEPAKETGKTGKEKGKTLRVR